MQKYIVIGRLTKDAELRYSATNKAIGSLSVAINNGRNSEGKELTTFINFKCFGSLAENCKKYLTKGRQVSIESTINNNNYEKDGKQVYDYEFIANNIEFLSSSNKTSNDSPENAPVREQVDPFAQFRNEIEINENSGLPF